MPSLESWLGGLAGTHRVVSHGGGFQTLHAERSGDSARLFDPVIASLASATEPVKLAPGWSAYDAWRTDHGYGLFASCDDDWSDRLHVAEGDDTVPRVALTTFVDVGERSGCDFDTWRALGIPDRNSLMVDGAMPWSAVREVVDALEKSIGAEAFRRGCRELADLNRDISPLLPRDVAGVYRFVHESVITAMWRPFVPRVVSVREGVTCVRLTMRAGLAGCRSIFASHAGTLESFPRHLELPFGSVPITAIEANSRATYLVRHAVNGTGSDPVLSVEVPDEYVGPGQLVQTRTEARRRASAELGAVLAALSSPHEIADAFVDGLFALAPVARVELDVVDPEGVAHPFRRRGQATGTATRRVLRHLERVVGELRVFADASGAGELFAALDLLQPWLGSALGVALLSSTAAHATVDSDEESRALQGALFFALARLERPAYLLSSGGSLTAMNTSAERVVSQDPSLPDELATALAARPSEQYEALRIPVELGGYLLVRRDRSPPLSSQLDDWLHAAGLTARRRQVALMALEGATVSQVATALCIRESTVRSHLAAVYRALNVDGQLQLLTRVVSRQVASA